MVSMTSTAGSSVGTVGPGLPFTVDDLAATPDDGRRYELVDGELLVSPAPGWPHQGVVLALGRLLDDACLSTVRVLIAPFAVRVDRHNELQPDVLVARYDDLTSANLPTAPLLAVEVISPTSRLTDANLKRAAYARMGVPSFWLVDPDKDHPVLTAYQLDPDADPADYRQLARVTGDEPFDATAPFDVRVVPSELVAKLHR